MRNLIDRIFLAALFLGVSLGCGGIGKVSELIDQNSKPKIVKSIDGKVQLTVPATWKKLNNLNEQAILQVAQPLQEAYAIVIPDPKEDFDETADVDFITGLIRKNTEESLGKAKFGRVNKVVINGYQARQFEVSGTVKKIKARYIFTIFDTPDSYYQIMSWTLASAYSKNKKKLLGVTSTFRLTDRKSRTVPPTSNLKTKRRH